MTDELTLTNSLYSFFFGSFLNTGLTVLCTYLLYRFLYGNSGASRTPSETFKPPPPLEKHNMTFDELRKYDGHAADGRICIAVLGKVFDVSNGRRFYGPGGPYSNFAGRDATRALATFDVNAVKDDYDEYSDLTPSQRSSVEEWQMQLSERYDLVGDLIRPDADTSSSNENTTESSSGDKVNESNDEKSQ